METSFDNMISQLFRSLEKFVYVGEIPNALQVLLAIRYLNYIIQKVTIDRAIFEEVLNHHLQWHSRAIF